MTVNDLINALVLAASQGHGDKLVQLAVTVPAIEKVGGSGAVEFRQLLQTLNNDDNHTTLLLEG